MDFPVVMYRCESWIIKKAEHQRIDAFELWCWRRLLRVPWTERRSNQSILKEISPEYSLEGLMLKLKLQYFGHPMRRVESLEKTQVLEKINSKRRRRAEDEMVGWHHRLDGLWANSKRQGRTEEPGALRVHGVAKSQTRLSNWIITRIFQKLTHTSD